MKILIALFLAMYSSASAAGKDRTVLSKGFARDSSTTITRFSVDLIALNPDSTITVHANGGLVVRTLYLDSLPVRVRQGLQRINQDLKAELEK